MTGLSPARGSVRAMDDVHEESFSTALLARGKRLAIVGAALLWVASPLLIGAWVTVAVKLADRGHVGALLHAAMVVWALVCLVVLLAGFAMLLGGVFFWWRSRAVTQPPAARRASAGDAASRSARADMLRQMQQQLREDEARRGDGAHERGGGSDDAGIEVAEPSVERVEADDSEAPHTRR